ncbi:PHD finger protein 11-like isoform X2 [Labeo rohita]|uniref:PHD finger protein 11-like isoform X2 n=1 Tax=Labeo rohita TaxID=84645 RepID=UPI0021E1D3FF|nr:PHD finger protein 11-like isoform X2 [Labeo rohita]
MASGSHYKIICALCKKSDETKITGPLSSKGSISAHRNCLLFASGIYCKKSPIFDDLFGFEVEDVKKELKRGRRLSCHLCKKIGATAGCDVRRCKRSYHYPCAIEGHARTTEDPSKGRYVLFCKLHDPESKKPRSAGGKRPDLKRPERRDSNSSTGSSQGRESPVVLDSGVSTSPGCPVAADASDVSNTMNFQSSAALFWSRCNEVGWTKEIFSDLVSQLNSVGERVQSKEASQQEYDVALKVLGVSGQLPCIVSQLEQDLEKEEQDLQRKKATLRHAKAVLGV